MPVQTATVYTDGSCHTQHRTGGWAAIIFADGEQHTLSGSQADTTHNCMELTAVIEAITYIMHYHPLVAAVNIISDSQYVVGLAARREKLAAKAFVTNKGNDIRNADLVKTLLSLHDSMQLTFTKIKAHQGKNRETEHNIAADKLCRSIVRNIVAGLSH